MVYMNTYGLDGHSHGCKGAEDGDLLYILDTLGMFSSLFYRSVSMPGHQMTVLAKLLILEVLFSGIKTSCTWHHLDSGITALLPLNTTLSHMISSS